MTYPDDNIWHVRVEGGLPNCISTHGMAGYASGSYWDGEDIICPCGARIIHPPPISFIHKQVGVERYGPFGLFRRKLYGDVPRWPEWLGGKKGVKR